MCGGCITHFSFIDGHWKIVVAKIAYKQFGLYVGGAECEINAGGFTKIHIHLLVPARTPLIAYRFVHFWFYTCSEIPFSDFLDSQISDFIDFRISHFPDSQVVAVQFLFQFYSVQFVPFRLHRLKKSDFIEFRILEIRFHKFADVLFSIF